MTYPIGRYWAKVLGVVLAGLYLLNAVYAQDSNSIDKEVLLHKAQDLLERGREFQKKRAYSESIPPAEQALAIYEMLSGPDSLDAAAAFDLLGRGQRFAGDFAHAEPNIRKALTVREKLLGPDDPLTADSLNNLGGFYNLTYRNKEAESVYQRVLAIREKVLGRLHPDTGQALNNLAAIYLNTGRYARGQALLQRALEVFEKAFGPDSLQAADTLTNLAGAYERTGESSRAEALLERSIAIKEKVLGAGHPSIATELEVLSKARALSGAFDRALPDQLRALALREKSLGAEHPSVATTLHNLANLYKNLGDFQEAERVFLRTRAIREKTLGSDSLATAYVLNDLAELYYTMGSYAKARALLETALTTKEKVGSLDASYAITLHNLGKVNAHLGADALATSYFQRALARRESVLGLKHPSVAETLNEIAALEWARGERAKALALLRRAHKTQTESVEPLLLGSESRKQAYLQLLSQDTYRYVSFSLAASTRGSVQLGLDSVLHYKSLVLDIMSDSTARLRASVRPDDRALFEEFTDVASQLSALAYRESGGDSDESRKQRDSLRAQQEKLETQLSSRSIVFRQQMTPTTVTTLQRAIPPAAALVEWLRYTPFEPRNLIARDKVSEVHPEPRYAVFIVKRNSEPIVIDVGAARAIDALVHDLRLTLSDANARTGTSIDKLSRALITPLWPHLQDVGQLFLSPDGALNLVPVAALVDPKGDYLAQRFEISYLTSGRDLLRAAPRAKSQGADVIVANANFGLPTYLIGRSNNLPSAQRSVDMDRGGLVFRPLANTELEARDLQRILNLPISSLLLRDEATEAKLRELHGPRILHIATHGFFLSTTGFVTEARKGVVTGQMAVPDENPLVRSGLALSGANARRSGERDDGILTALEAAQLDLRGTELVVLSACDTGVGEVTNGEGVYGLRRALVLAGAETQVTSLWKVSDEATRTLMSNYYERLLKGEGRSDALRHAQLDIIAVPKYSHPYYWASFVSAGNWKPLSRR